jgi:hypothetical protein
MYVVECGREYTQFGSVKGFFVGEVLLKGKKLNEFFQNEVILKGFNCQKGERK